MLVLRSALVGLTALCMLACNSTSDADTHAQLESDAAVQDVTHDVPSREQNAAVPDAAVPDIAVPDGEPDTIGGSWRDGGLGGPFDAAVCALPEETSDPPPDCIAPCMWAVMKSCHLSKCCVVDDSVGAYHKLCDHRGVLDISASFGGMSGEVVYAADGSFCYRSSAQGVPGGSGGSVAFKNGKGEIFAVMEWLPSSGGDDLRRVSCSGEVFNLNLAQPKCAPWTHHCEPGKCPDQP